MKRINLSTQKISQFAGKWIAINPKKAKIVAVGETLKDISPLVAGNLGDEKKIKAYAFKVPRKGEGPYVLFY